MEGAFDFRGPSFILVLFILSCEEFALESCNAVYLS